MYSLLLAIIYVAFVSLGLPDSLLGSGWPSMQAQMGVPLSYAGVISMIITAGTIVSSLLTGKVLKKWGTGLVTAGSVLVTAVALFGFSTSAAFWMLCLWAIPYGLGAGAIDAALNHYVALHYASRHMSWLHCFWGLGATISPYIMSYCLLRGFGWDSGYRSIAVLQIALTAVLFFSLPLWKKRENGLPKEEAHAAAPKLSEIFRIRGVKHILLAFFSYCALETTVGLWASSYLALGRGVASETAAQYASLFYMGITGGRFLSGFVADRLGDRRMIQIGIAVMLVGIAAVGLPIQAEWVCLYGLVVIGLGCAPVYPSIIHATPSTFGAEHAQAIVGVQMASAYTGAAFIPPLFGLIANHMSVNFFSVFIMIFAIIIVISTQKLNKMVSFGRVK